MKLAGPLTFLLLVVASRAPLSAEVPNLSKEKLQQGASHIVVGKVQAVYASAKKGPNRLHFDLVTEIFADRIALASM